MADAASANEAAGAHSGGVVDALRQALVDGLIERGFLSVPRIADAFRHVPRHLFVPSVPPTRAYRDEAIPTRFREGRAISSCSQPAIVAWMLQQLAPRPGQRVLEVGAGTGYNAALLSDLVGAGGRVTTLELDGEIAAAAREHLAAAGVSNVDVVCTDGGLGWPAGAPYDRMIVTAGATEVPPTWRQQLGDGGLLVLPLWLRCGYASVALKKVGEALESLSLLPCGFMPLRGTFTAEGLTRSLPGAGGFWLMAEPSAAIDLDAIAGRLQEPRTALPTGVALRVLPELGADLYGLAAELPGFAQLWQGAEAAQLDPLPSLRILPGGARCAGCLIAGDSLALLTLAEGDSWAAIDPASSGESQAIVWQCGADATAARSLLEVLQRWAAAGRPGLAELRLRL